MDDSGGGFLLIILICVVIGLVPAFIAHGKGRSFILWWIYGAALFVIALIHSLAMANDVQSLDQRVTASGDYKKCPHCAEIIRSEAKVCRFCGRDVTPKEDPALEPQSIQDGESDEMASLGITLVGQKYVFKTFRYDKLSDALAYARIENARALKSGESRLPWV